MISNASQNGQKSKSSYPVIGIISAIVLIIVATAFYHSQRFAARVKYGEAHQNLSAIYNAYQAYHSDHQTYPSSPSIQFGNTAYNCFTISDWDPKGLIRYDYKCMNTIVFSPSRNGVDCPPEILTSTTRDSFTVAACGNVDDDTTVDVWTIDDAKHLRNIVDDVKN